MESQPTHTPELAHINPGEPQPLADLERIDAAATLIAFMRHRDVECPACKYSLRNLTSFTCPECGSRLVLGVQQADPYLLAWITAAIALALPCSFSILLFAVLLHEHQWPHVSSWKEAYLLATIVLAPILLAAMLFLRRRFLLLARPMQRSIAYCFVGNDVLGLVLILYDLFRF